MKILKIIAISVMALALPLSAYAQGRGIDRKKEKEDTALDIEKERLKKSSTKIRYQYNHKEYDPWAGVRKAICRKNSRCEKEDACSSGRTIVPRLAPTSCRLWSLQLMLARDRAIVLPESPPGVAFFAVVETVARTVDR